MLMTEIIEDMLLMAADGRQMMREVNTKTPNGNPMGGRWVLRDVNGVFIDFDQYRHDLMERHGLKPDYCGVIAALKNEKADDRVGA